MYGLIHQLEGKLKPKRTNNSKAVTAKNKRFSIHNLVLPCTFVVMCLLQSTAQFWSLVLAVSLFRY